MEDSLHLQQEHAKVLTTVKSPTTQKLSYATSKVYVGDMEPHFLDEHRFTEPAVALGVQMLTKGPQH